MDDQANPYTYEQAAVALGIQAEAVRARLRRGALRRGPRTNDGRPTVLLSPDDITTIRSGVRTVLVDSGPDSGWTPDESPTIKALESEAVTLREALAREQELGDQARALAEKRAEENGDYAKEVGALRERLGRAEGEAAALRAQMQAERDRAEADAARMRHEVEGWSAGGAFERALRAFMWRRG